MLTDNAGTLMSESKSTEAKMLSIPGSPVSVGGDSRIELDVIVEPRYITVQEKLKPILLLTDIPEQGDTEHAKQGAESQPEKRGD